ncbi:HNH endonuclease [Arthrobacter phage Beagle]|nr:HNH endonuclease [Arthrobacter phage Beagle]
MSAIPTRSRLIVKERSNNQCSRCGNLGGEWHHRRRRGIKAGHDPHCPCIGVWLCNTCHRFVHANPVRAQELGLIISAYEEEPWNVPMSTFMGWVANDCDGNVSFTSAPSP